MTDVLVIGAGPAGALAALRAADLGARTVLLTSSTFGGMAANDGPVPVRTLAHAARLISEARQLGEDPRRHGAAVEVLAAVAVAVDREEDLRLDLREAVDHRARAELGRGARPDRPQGGRREERDERLGNVRHVCDDTVAAADAERA